MDGSSQGQGLKPYVIQLLDGSSQGQGLKPYVIQLLDGSSQGQGLKPYVIQLLSSQLLNSLLPKSVLCVCVYIIYISYKKIMLCQNLGPQIE